MSALAADKSAVCDGSHWLKLVARDAVRASNYGHGHRYIQEEPLFRVKVPPAMNSTRRRLQGCEESQLRCAPCVINHRATRPVNRADYVEQWQKSVLVLLVLKVSNFEQSHK
jgi:hypothetical protein